MQYTCSIMQVQNDFIPIVWLYVMIPSPGVKSRINQVFLPPPSQGVSNKKNLLTAIHFKTPFGLLKHFTTIHHFCVQFKQDSGSSTIHLSF